MKVKELNKEQLLELKKGMIYEYRQEYSVSEGEFNRVLNAPDDYISDEEVFRKYREETFLQSDFTN